MRKKIVAQRSIFDQAIRTLTALVKPDQELKRIDAVIDKCFIDRPAAQMISDC
jgi:hypothetical protein